MEHFTTLGVILCRGHANLYVVPILVSVLPKRVLQKSFDATDFLSSTSAPFVWRLVASDVGG